MTRLNQRVIRTMSDFRNQVALIAVGDTFEVQFFRVNVSQATRMAVAPVATATQVAAMSPSGADGGKNGGGIPGGTQNTPRPGGPSSPNNPGAGLPSVSADGLFAGLTFTETKDGLLVGRVERSSPAFSAGMREGDILLAMDRQALTSVAQLRQRLQSGPRPRCVSYQLAQV